MNNDLKKVIIIISNYNGATNKYKNKPLLYWPLNSLKKTKYKNYKIILADDCSTDNSIKYVKNNFPYVEIVKNKENGGYSKNNNNAIRYCLRKYKPDYILLLNNDIIITEKDWLGKLVKVAESNNNIGLVGCKLVYPNNRIQHAGIILRRGVAYNRGRGEKNEGQYNNIEEMQGITFAMALIKKYVFNKVGLLDENFFMGYEDVDYCIRTKKERFKIIYNGNVKLQHLEGFSSTNSKNNEIKKELFYKGIKNYIYFAYKDLNILDRYTGIIITLLGTIISIEAPNRKRSIFNIRFKNNMIENIKLAIHALRA